MTKPPIWAGLGVIYLLISGIILPEILGLTRSDYTSVSNYLSELGATGTSTQTLANLFGFLPVAISCLVILYYLWSKLERTGNVSTALIMIGIGIPAGYLGAVIFPCDYGCPIEGSFKQGIHNLLGLVQYPLGAIGFILLGASLKHSRAKLFSILAGCAMGLGFLMMLMPDQVGFRGAWQRLGDYSAFIVLSYFVFMRPQAKQTVETS